MSSTRPLVIYHGGGCRDGFCSAWLMKRAYTSADFYPANYGEQPPIDWCGRDVFILDFSYPRSEMENIIAQSASVVCLDHHKTAMAALSVFCFDFPCPRCNAIHGPLTINPILGKPILIVDDFELETFPVRATHSATCPNHAGPILVAIDENDAANHPVT